MSATDGRRATGTARQPLRLDRAAQPARLRRRRDLRGDGARPRRRASASTTCRSTASRRRASPTGASAGSRSSSSSSPAPPLALRDLRRRPRRRGRRRARRSTTGRPALLLTDLYYLDHYGNSAHFPGHAVVLAGYDDEVAYLSDTGFEELQTTEARAPRRGAPRSAPGVPARRARWSPSPTPSALRDSASARRARDRAQRAAR